MLNSFGEIEKLSSMLNRNIIMTTYMNSNLPFYFLKNQSLSLE